MATAYSSEFFKNGVKMRRVYDETVTPSLANYQGGMTERKFTGLEWYDPSTSEWKPATDSSYKIHSSPNS